MLRAEDSRPTSDADIDHAILLSSGAVDVVDVAECRVPAGVEVEVVEERWTGEVGLEEVFGSGEGCEEEGEELHCERVWL